MSETKILACAKVAHEANRIYCEAIGDTSQVPFDQAPDWQKQSAIDGVRVALTGATPEKQHEAWCSNKRAAGWTYGEVKDAEAKTHPCLVPYTDLPAEQRAKDALYGAVVRAMHAALSGD